MQVLCSLCRIASTLVLAGSLAIAQAPVVVVDDDGGPGVDYTLLHQATAEAADGSVILVKPGDYAGAIVVDAKSLVITADEEGDVRIDYRIFVKHLTASQSAVLRGLRFDSLDLSGGTAGIDISANAGPVLVQSCVVAATHGSYPVNVFESASVTFVDCDLLGGYVDPPFTNAALSAKHSNVTVYNSSLLGQKGKSGGGLGGHGAVLTGGTLFASGSTFQGGQGASGSLDPFSTCTFGGPGGHGLMFFENPEVFLLDSVTAGGAGGPALPPCAPGAPGVPIYGEGTVTSYLGQARSLAPLSPIELGQTATLSFAGKPGDIAVSYTHLTLPTILRV